MNIKIRKIRKKDYQRAIQFSIKGMHFDWYLKNQFLLNAYGKYFWYLEYNRATRAYAAYLGEELIGVLLAEIYGEPKQHHSWYEQLYVRVIDFVQNTFFKDGAGVYEKTCEEQKAHFFRQTQPDGEIIFLAADPDSTVKGIGTALLKALENDTQNKTLFLFTDNACTYQFYEHRGFERMEETDIIMDLPKGKVPLKCFIYSRKM